MKTPIRDGLNQNDQDFGGFKPINANLADYAGANVTWNTGSKKFDATGGSATTFNVKTYGAAGNGVTDDTTAIQTALAAIPSVGGVLYFPAGRYKYTGTTLTLDRKITVLGDGGRFFESGSLAPSMIEFNSGTGTLFTVTASSCTFREIALLNTYVGTPSAGAGIAVTGSGGTFDGSRTSYNNMSIAGFYICVDVQAGSFHCFDNCKIDDPALYALRLRNILSPDGGDHSISNCYFGATRPATSAIRIESGGGIKIVNTKINAHNAPNGFTNGIDLAVANGVNTVDLAVTNCSLENFSGAGIKGRTGTGSSWGWITITGNEFLPNGLSYSAAIDFSGTTATDFDGLVITGNFASGNGASVPMIALINCSHVTLTGNSQKGFTGIATIGSGVSFAMSETIPPGGTTGQILKKLSNANYDIGWVT